MRARRHLPGWAFNGRHGDEEAINSDYRRVMQKLLAEI